MQEFILSRSKFPADKLTSIYEKKDDYYFSSKEALKYGLIDEVL
jgi:ATP-dependent protease ClpP protease subunit